MKWVWWIGGVIVYLICKNEVNTGVQVLILLIATLMGERADKLAKEQEQRERDELADEIKRQLEEKASNLNPADAPRTPK